LSCDAAPDPGVNCIIVAVNNALNGCPP